MLAKDGQRDAAREQIISAARQLFGATLRDWNAEEGKDFYISELGESDFGPNPELLDPTVVMFGLFGIVQVYLPRVKAV